MNYAILDENNVVVNIIYCLGPFPDGILLDDIPATMGDVYKDGCFYRNGERVMSVVEELDRALAILLYGVEYDE